MVSLLESAGQIYPETGLTFEAPKCVLASEIIAFVSSQFRKLSVQQPAIVKHWDVRKSE
jgi:hypothetical protein